MVTKKIPTLHTTRLTLRPFSLGDAKEVQHLAGHPLVAATTATIPHPYLDGLAESWISQHDNWFQKSNSVNWAIEHMKDQRLIGCLSFAIDQGNARAEMGYWIGVDFWNHGYCSEAAAAGISWMFQNIDLNKITSRHLSENSASGRVMLKVGMKQEGYLRQNSIKNGKFVDHVIYGLLRGEQK